MTKFKTLTVSAAAIMAAALLTPAAFANGDKTLVIENFVGRVDIQTEEGANLDVREQGNAGSVSYEETGKTLEIDGGIKKPDSKKCVGYYGKFSWKSDKSERKGEFGGYRDLETFPKLLVTAPDDVTLVIRNSILFGTAGNLGAADIEDRHCSKFTMGDIDGALSLSISGSGDFTGGNVGDADVSVRGSGDADFGDARRVDIGISGSGDVTFENVGPASIELSGSGDIELGTVQGSIVVAVRGSGDVNTGDVYGGADLKSSGSSDIEIKSIDGPLSVISRGSSTIEIDGGTAPIAEISVSGSGTVNFEGTADMADLSASGSGDIYIDEVTGMTKSRESGSGDIHIGG